MVVAIQLTAFTRRLLTKEPILALSLVKITKGTTAELSCKDNITCLKTSRFPVPFPP
jgi:hypothetical protein